MPMNVTPIFFDGALKRLDKLFDHASKDNQETICDKVIEFTEMMEEKYKKVKKVMEKGINK